MNLEEYNRLISLYGLIHMIL